MENRPGTRVTTKRLFALGRIVATHGASAEFDEGFMIACLCRHATGDFGDLDAEDQRANRHAVNHGLRVLSQYKDGERVLWVITEADRSSTTCLTPSEY